MGATVVLVCASHSTSHFTLQSQLSELPRRSLHHEVGGGGTEGAGSQLLCHPGPLGFQQILARLLLAAHAASLSG